MGAARLVRNRRALRIIAICGGLTLYLYILLLVYVEESVRVPWEAKEPHSISTINKSPKLILSPTFEYPAPVEKLQRTVTQGLLHEPLTVFSTEEQHISDYMLSNKHSLEPSDELTKIQQLKTRIKQHRMTLQSQ